MGISKGGGYGLMDKCVVLLKTITYRLTGLAMMVLMSPLFGMDMKEGIVMALVFNGVRMIQYYFHEMVWDVMVRWWYGSSGMP